MAWRGATGIAPRTTAVEHAGQRYSLGDLEIGLSWPLFLYEREVDEQPFKRLQGRFGIAPGWERGQRDEG